MIQNGSSETVFVHGRTCGSLAKNSTKYVIEALNDAYWIFLAQMMCFFTWSIEKKTHIKVNGLYLKVTFASLGLVAADMNFLRNCYSFHAVKKV